MIKLANVVFQVSELVHGLSISLLIWILLQSTKHANVIFQSSEFMHAHNYYFDNMFVAGNSSE